VGAGVLTITRGCTSRQAPGRTAGRRADRAV